VLIDRLKSFITGEMERALFLNDIPSGPEALLVSIARRRPNTYSSVQRMVSGGIVEGLTMKCWESASVKGGII